MRIIKFFPHDYVAPRHFTLQIPDREWDDSIRRLVSEHLPIKSEDNINRVAWIVEADGKEKAYFLEGRHLYETSALLANQHPGITPGFIVWSENNYLNMKPNGIRLG